MTENLKPCPDCGNTYPTVVVGKVDYKTLFNIWCFKCGASSLPADTFTAAVENWNRMAGDPTLAEDPAEDVW